MQRILSVNEKLPVSKFEFFEKYMKLLDGYIYVHVSGQSQTALEKTPNYTSPGTMVHVIHMLIVFSAVFKHLKASFS